ncbi:hypothetical protein RhiirA4_458653 [Rhizophagus irregularis]|uniref:Uncharacterized protein n=1 Tax=Rhizophagus irregularis TaxID=588596 RepID=A0A2I1GCL1_9GLOM|nr:hypothetical protein RhiirA4_458653 [Rhizophagus irregularis]
MFEYEKYMSKYESESMDRIHPNLPEEERKRILVVHDECIFYSNDGKCELRLRLQQTDIEKHLHIPEAARCYLKPGINQDGYWTVEHLPEQIEYKAIPIFKTLYPDCSYRILTLSQITNYYNQWYWLSNIPTTHNDEKLRGKPKGIKQVLMKCGKWPPGGLVLN